LLRRLRRCFVFLTFHERLLHHDNRLLVTNRDATLFLSFFRQGQWLRSFNLLAFALGTRYRDLLSLVIG
jgi:hypothetical protein